MHIPSPAIRLALIGSAAILLTTSIVAAENPFLGRWALTIPGGGAGWLGVAEDGGQLQGSILWGGGSVVPVTSTKVEGDTLIVTRVNDSRQKDADGKTVVKKTTETITAKLDGDNMKLTTSTMGDDGKARGLAAEFTGKRIPPVPAAPDLAKVKFGAPITLFNGKDLSGWKTMGKDPSAWKAVDGILSNEAVQEKGKHKSYANIRTEREFEDFNIQLEFRVPEDGNSGVYLRGIYEVQVANSYGRRNDPHNCGALYSRIMPSENVSKPPGEWQTFDITLVDRHLTVIHNGKKTIDNQPVLGCTGGALWSDESRPGPIYLQGDHTSVDYRNMVLRPVVR
jgi:3-keto-disaccharide hydrolase